MNDNREFKDKRILLLGAGGLLGNAVAHSLQSAGAKLICADKNVSQMKRRLKERGLVLTNNIEIISVDVTDQAEVEKLFFDLRGLSGAVNCSYPKNESFGSHFFDVTLNSFNENLALNLGSSFLFMQQCASYFLKNKQPFSLVNIASIYGVVAPKFDVYQNTAMTMPVEYAAIKAALLNLSKYVTSYVHDSNFRVNSISPGGLLDDQPSQFL